jgi:selenocysteine lyase/cysteine desulfurase
MANEEQLELLEGGTKAWNRWREANPDIRIDLEEADLREKQLYRANLSGANLVKADLSGANLREAILDKLKTGMSDIRAYERPLAERLISGLMAIPGVTLYGITGPARLDQRAPTVAFTLEGYTPRQVAEQLG